MNAQELIQTLTKIVGQEYVLASETDLAVYGYDGSLHRALPDVIVLPRTTEQVSAIVSLASKEGIPVVARGSGTNLSGGSFPLKGGIVIHFSRMNKILGLALRCYAGSQAGKDSSSCFTLPQSTDKQEGSLRDSKDSQMNF